MMNVEKKLHLTKEFCTILENKIISLCDDISILKKRNADKNNQITSLLADIDVLKKTNTKKNEEINSLNLQLNLLKEENNKLNKTIDEIKNTNTYKLINFIKKFHIFN